MSPTTRDSTVNPTEPPTDSTVESTKMPSTATTATRAESTTYSVSTSSVSTKSHTVSCIDNNIIFTIQFGYTVNNNANKTEIMNTLTETADDLMQNTIKCVISNYTKSITINMTMNVANIMLYICADCSNEEPLEASIEEQLEREIIIIDNNVLTVNAKSTIISVEITVNDAPIITTQETDISETSGTAKNSPLWPILGATLALILLGGIVLFVVIKRKKKLDIAVETLEQSKIVLNKDDEIEEMYINVATPTGDTPYQETVDSNFSKDILDDHDDESVEKMYDRTQEETDRGIINIHTNEESVEKMYDNLPQQTETGDGNIEQSNKIEGNVVDTVQ